MCFQDRVVVVTGGGSGIGEALATQAAEEGASHVAVVDRQAADASDWSEPSEVAQLCFEAMAEERFLVLPQPVVATQAQRKASDIDRWLNGMGRLQARAYEGFPLPGDMLVGRD